MKTASVAVFIIQLMPELRALAQALFARHDGNVEAARAELRRVKDHGAQLANFEEQIKVRMQALKDKAAAREAGRLPPMVPTPEPIEPDGEGEPPK